MTPSPQSKHLSAKAEIERREFARYNLLGFMRYCWWQPTPLIEGIHTRRIANRITRAVDDFQNGKSTFLCISVPFRHGKSDMVSRALPAWFVGACRDSQPDIMCTGYGSNLVKKFSRVSRKIVASEPYQILFPTVRLGSRRTDAHWKVDYFRGDEWRQSSGDTTVAGLKGDLAGSGYHLGILDDFCKRRDEAESEVFRDATWDSFTNDLLTRRAPVSITIVTATSWHVDDVIGRIRQHMHDDPAFPRFEFSIFPARGPGRIGGQIVEYGDREFLFEERFGRQWYREQYASLGTYGASGLLDCSPTVESGNMFPIDRIVYHDSVKEFPDCRYVRFWDVASTEKEVAKDDPDYTVGVLCGVTHEKSDGGDIVPHLWVKDLSYGQWAATRRTARWRAIAADDGPSVKILVEAVAGYKDAPELLASSLRGIRSVAPWPATKDLVARSAVLEPVFEAGHVHILRGPWNDFLLKHFREFPWGTHDDGVAALTGAFEFFTKDSGLMTLNRRALGL